MIKGIADRLGIDEESAHKQKVKLLQKARQLHKSLISVCPKLWAIMQSADPTLPLSPLQKYPHRSPSDASMKGKNKSRSKEKMK